MDLTATEEALLEAEAEFDAYMLAIASGDVPCESGQIFEHKDRVEDLKAGKKDLEDLIAELFPA